MQVLIFPEDHQDSSPLRLVGGWEQYADVSARVDLWYRQSKLLVSFTVSEPELRREVHSTNGPVCEDSCVEVFLKQTEEDDYVNIEASASGALHVATGPDRHHRRFLDPALIQRIPLEVQVKEHDTRKTVWVLKEELDLAMLGLVSPGTDLKGMHLKGNFYTCGDKLKRPIWLLWNPVDSPKPDFHRPECFGDLYFI